jgi:hypothetical protein
MKRLKMKEITLRGEDGREIRKFRAHLIKKFFSLNLVLLNCFNPLCKKGVEAQV